ncbi:MAG: bifunctional 5,10-methylenetetrahydrofolate dehydrogenase/5,10-methenyltetrahydrofolate cyclohydrolase [Trueperaceae bacterium]|nr:bifunctional 5,10-methylenetetrahydrofolate dehydrogenase/5,10-methenyltetrahydrofolate cyclohydrolase [Trueperaceae bacterium]
MAAERLDGSAVAAAVVESLRERIETLSYVPKLVFVRVGDDPASTYYVKSKGRLAAKVGLRTETIVLDASSTQAELENVVRRLNADPEVDGILVQLPLPDTGFDERKVLELIDPAKDVDGLHPVNVGRLWSGQAGLVPATPMGVIELLDRYQIELEGKRALVIGRSNLVGKPVAALLLRRNATVTLAHSRTRDLAEAARQADVLVAAVGVPWLMTPDMVKPGAAVLDVGVSRVDGSIRGDVHPDVGEVAGYLTPMPGGTGPMTVAMVISNTVTAAALRRSVP